MCFRTRWIFAVLSLGAVLLAPPVQALPPGDVSKIAAQTQLDMPLPVNGTYEMRTLIVDSVGTFKDGDGSEWLRVEGKAPDEEEGYTLFVDAAEGQVEMGLMVGSVELPDLAVTIEQLREMAKARQGKVNYDGKKFSFSAAGRSVFTANPDAKPSRVGYFILQCDEDSNLSLMVLNWGDHAEVMLNERLDAAQVQLAASGK